jgi:hypothetical protein
MSYGERRSGRSSKNNLGRILTGELDMKLNVRAFAIAAAVWWGGAVFILTWWLILLEGASGQSTALARIYIGYEISPLGSVIAAR